MQTLTTADFARRRLTALLDAQRAPDFMRDITERADAKFAPYVPVTVPDRLKWFGQIGYRPHGLYLPDDEKLRFEIVTRLRVVGDLPDLDTRLAHYTALQDETAALEQQGLPGRWGGQQALARSPVRFRLVEYGRRSGKTYHAAREGACIVRFRPGSRVWCCAPDMGLVDRTFSFVKQILIDAEADIVTLRDNDDEKLIVLANRAVVEGISLHNYNRPGGHSAAGVAVDLAIVDEAAYIAPEAWTIAILPTLTDRNGQALFLSTPAGIDAYFHKLAAEGETKENWEIFQEESWASNFYMFPQGRQTPTLVEAEGEMEPLDFLEQFGAVPQASRRLIYPQFKEKVHASHPIPFDPNYEVKLGVDPSGGANEYAVIAAQDKGETLDFIDEFYVPGAVAEDIGPVLDLRRPWRDHVTAVVVDSAWPSDIMRWAKMGWPAFPVYEKPQVEQRLPLYRRMLRDPLRFYRFYMERVKLVLAEWGYTESDYTVLDKKVQAKIAIAVEELLADTRLTPPDIAALKACSHIRIDPVHCPNFIREHKGYRYRPPRPGQSPHERPVKSNDHLMDAAGYLIWQFKRFDDMGVPYVAPDTTTPAPNAAEVEEQRLAFDALRTQPAFRFGQFVADARSQARIRTEPRERAGTVRLKRG